MKVLFVTNIPVPYRINFFNELGKLCDLTVVFEAQDVHGILFNWNLDNICFFKSVFLSPHVIQERKIHWNVFKYLDKNKFDVIVMGGYATLTQMGAILYMNFEKIPFVLSVDGGLIRDDGRWKKKIKSYLIGSASGWMSTGQSTTEYLLHYGAKAERVYIYPFTSLYAADIVHQEIDDEEKIRVRKVLDIKEKKMILAVGQFIHRKGYDVLLNACTSLDNTIGIYIVGGNVSDEYLKLVRKLKLKNVHFIDFKTKDELNAYYKAADVFVLPTREDVWGLVINEAMAVGLPVITTDKCVAGLELIENGRNGYIVKTEDYIALKDKIIEVLNNDAHKKMSEYSLGKIKGYTLEAMAIKHMEILNRFISC